MLFRSEREERGAIPAGQVSTAALPQPHHALRKEQRGHDGERYRQHYNPRSFAITMRCTSFVPSPISRIFWSRYRREMANSSMKP